MAPDREICQLKRVDLLLDITRTIARARLPAPTGIDRVERAYIDWALDRGAQFLAKIDSRQRIVGAETVRRLLDWLEGSASAPAMDLRAQMRPDRDVKLRRAQALIRREALGSLDDANLLSGGLYLNSGHDNLDSDLMQSLGGSGWRRVVLLHDAIPLDHPEFARPGTPEIFRRKLDAAAMADGLIFNSVHTANRVTAHLPAPVRASVIAPLGIDPPVIPDERTIKRPYFVALGTIEPRKNHALLLDLWAQMESPPPLHVFGRRGWQNQAVFDLLDRAPFMRQTVFEHGATDDRQIAAYLAGAAALLFPSFDEGFGLPLAEALALGCPVIASDLPALREVGGDVPDWLGPTDREGWERAIRDYTAQPAPRRDAQLARMTGWQAPTWDAHFRVVENLLETILVQSRQGG